MSRSVLLVIACFCLSSCSSTPEDAKAQDALAQKVGSAVAGANFEIRSFNKTNGQSFEINGVKGYRLFYSAVIAFPSGFRPDCVQDDGRFAGFNCVFSFGASKSIVSPQPRGSVVTYAGEVNFEKSEQGWLYNNVTLNEQSKTIEDDDTPARLSSSNPDFLSGRNWESNNGIYLLLDTPSASSKNAAANITAFWGKYLDQAGVRSYKLEWHKPDRLFLCLPPNTDVRSVKLAIMQNTLGAQDLRVIEETQTGENCEYQKSH